MHPHDLASHAVVKAQTVLVGDLPPIGRFDHVTLRRNGPRALTTWQVTTADTRIAVRLARLLGGRIQQHTSGAVEVITAIATLPIMLDGPSALRLVWQQGRGRVCDGSAQDDGHTCVCPAALALRRAMAKRGAGCQPCAEIRFRLPHDAALGVFVFASEDWSFVELVTETRSVLCQGPQPTTAQLGLRRTLHRLASGRDLAYTRPVLRLDKHPR